MKEDFQYDNLDRLDNVYMGGNMTLDMAYNSDKGSITYKSDVGTLVYDTPGKPYAVSGIDPSTGLTPESDQTITYNSFESINTISEDVYSATFIYNSDNERTKMELQQNGGTILTRWYPSESYIKETSGGVTKEYTFIGGDEYTAPAVAIKTNGGNPVYYYLLRDHLGSITHVVDATNNSVVAEYSYDSWGRMRNPATWENYTPGSEPSLFIAGRGYTGHEHLPWFNSINMNGRVYDPLIGQFLSPDNYVQSPDFTQSFNRYGYCLNNPLAYTDPSGEFVFSLFLPVIGPFLDAACWGAVIGGAGYTANVAFSDGGFNNWNWGQFGKSVGIGAISGAVTAGIGNAFGAVGSNGISGEFARACTHGFANGIISEFSGGDFMSGFVSGGLGSLGGSAFMMYGGSFASSNLGNYAFSGLAGGIGTELTGGNFWQGAATGLITAGLNHLQQGISYSIRSGDRELNPDNYVLKNNKVRSNVKQLYEGLVDVMGTEEFQFMVTGGDRYVGPDGKVYSSTDNSLIPTSGKAHILGLAVDLRIIYNNGHYIPLDFVRPIVINSTKFIFDPNAMPWHYSDWHYHLQLPRIP
ncbi:MAG TPA: hypothetical protein DFI01_04450 [Bacteroidales bacterium]|nr:hypothetical protein [Bacteroidales bacterium]